MADDPLWWRDSETALLAGTRLEIAVKEHRKIAAKLSEWRDRLAQLQRLANASSPESLVAAAIWRHLTQLRLQKVVQGE